MRHANPFVPEEQETPPPPRKRAREDTAVGSEGTTSKPSGSKRPKSVQACASCRKHKTRCELLDRSHHSSLRCHRCDVLSLPCSFEGIIGGPSPRATGSTDHAASPDARQSLGEVMIEAMAPREGGQDSTDGTNASGKTKLPPWDFLVERLPDLEDWSATPVLAMQKISNSYIPEQTNSSVPQGNVTFEGLIPSDQRQHLLQFFDLHYRPWLALPEADMGQDNFLDLVRCSIASRHLDPVSRSAVSTGLRKLTEEAVIRHVFNTSPSPAVVQAFAILSQWMPLGGPSPSKGDTHDNRLIAGAAINMAISLHLNDASSEVRQLNERIEAGERSPALDKALSIAECKLSQWISLHIVEAMVCLGTGRMPTSQLSDLDVRLNQPICTSTAEGCRICRLLLVARVCHVTEAGLRLILQTGPGQVDAFYQEVADVLYRFDGLKRVVRPLPVVADHDAFYFHMAEAQYHFCRLLFISHALRQLRVLPTVPGRDGFYKAKRQGSDFALSGARDALCSAETVLVAILSISDKTALATAPDAIFPMILYAAAYIIAAKFLVLSTSKVPYLPGSSDQVLRRVVELLTQIALSPDHHAARCARAIASFVDTWETKIGNESKMEQRVTSELNGDAPASTTGVRDFDLAPSTNSWFQEDIAGLPLGLDGLDYLQGIDQEAFLNQDFWQYFAPMASVQNSVPHLPNMAPGLDPFALNQPGQSSSSRPSG